MRTKVPRVSHTARLARFLEKRAPTKSDLLTRTLSAPKALPSSEVSLGVIVLGEGRVLAGVLEADHELVVALGPDALDGHVAEALEGRAMASTLVVMPAEPWAA